MFGEWLNGDVNFSVELLMHGTLAALILNVLFVTKLTCGLQNETAETGWNPTEFISPIPDF